MGEELSDEAAAYLGKSGSGRDMTDRLAHRPM